MVVAIRDPYLGIHQGKTSTTLKPAAYSVRRSSFAIPSRRLSGDSVTLVDGRVGGSSRESNAGSRFWRFDWQAKRVPTFGFRYEGMDLTMDEGHALSFTDVVDDHGYPFAILELRLNKLIRPCLDGELGGLALGSGSGRCVSLMLVMLVVNVVLFGLDAPWLRPTLRKGVRGRVVEDEDG